MEIQYTWKGHCTWHISVSVGYIKPKRSTSMTLKTVRNSNNNQQQEARRISNNRRKRRRGHLRWHKQFRKTEGIEEIALLHALLKREANETRTIPNLKNQLREKKADCRDCKFALRGAEQILADAQARIKKSEDWIVKLYGKTVRLERLYQALTDFGKDEEMEEDELGMIVQACKARVSRCEG